MAKVIICQDGLSCWQWNGAKSGSGYGQFWNGTRSIPAHWFLLPVQPVKGQEACHHCDNRLCVNPDHIFVGTKSDNMRDMVAKGRHNPAAKAQACRNMLKVRKVHRGESNHVSKLTEEQARQAKACPRTYGAATKLAKAIGVSPEVVCGIRDGKRWTHL